MKNCPDLIYYSWIYTRHHKEIIMKLKDSCFMLSLMFLLPVVAHATTWTIDADHSSVGFKVKHLMVSNVKGTFQSFGGVIETDDKDSTKTRVTVTINVTSIDTNQSRRDDHLRSADFFDVEKFPLMTFVSKKIIKTGKTYTVVGDLSLHGVTKEVSLIANEPSIESKDPWGNTHRGISATTKISRKEFGMVWNKILETGGVLVGDEIDILLEIEGIKAK